MTTPAAPALDELALARFGLRFASKDTERRYRQWHAQQAMPFMRITYLVSIFIVIPAALVASYVAVPEALGTIAAWVLGFALPILVFGFASSYTAWMPRVMGIVSLLSNAATGCMFVALCFYPLHHPDFAMASVLIPTFLAGSVLRMQPHEAICAVLPYVALDEILMARSPEARDLLVPYSCLNVMAVAIGLLVAWMVDRSSRESYRQRRVIETQQQEIARERDRADQLLRNVLPVAIADRLKHNPARIAEHFDQVSVLFGDLVGFTQLSAQMSPQQLVAALDDMFTAFDDIAQRHGVEKIKTIGDAYMAVCGVPTPRADHAQAIAAMALEMQQAIARQGAQLTMRIGLHTGPAVAGVIGKHKFIYDLWGDTVNTASRMESHGAPGEIQISDATRAALGDGWVVEERGVVEIKGKGPMRTWWLRSRLPV